MIPQDIRKIYMAAFEKLHDNLGDRLRGTVRDQAVITVQFRLTIDGVEIDPQTLSGDILPPGPK